CACHHALHCEAHALGRTFPGPPHRRSKSSGPPRVLPTVISAQARIRYPSVIVKGTVVPHSILGGYWIARLRGRRRSRVFAQPGSYASDNCITIPGEEP